MIKRAWEWVDILLTQKKTFLNKYKYWKKRTWGFGGSKEIIPETHPYLRYYDQQRCVQGKLSWLICPWKQRICTSIYIFTKLTAETSNF